MCKKMLLNMCIAGAFGIMALPAEADGYQRSNSDAILGGAVGGGAGAAVGSAVGGRDGAILGGALGAATGVAIALPAKPVVVHEYPDIRPVIVHEYRDERPVVLREYRVYGRDHDWDHGRHLGHYKHHRHDDDDRD